MSKAASKIWKTSCVIAAAYMTLTPTAHASTADQIILDVKPTAFYEVVESGADFKTILVATNAPFDVFLEGAIGKVDVKLSTTGFVNGRAYGSKAQAPGDSSQSIHITSMFKTIIYEAAKQTAAGRGSVRQQAVQLTIRHDALANPKITVLAQH